jgi:hypothetical protein
MLDYIPSQWFFVFVPCICWDRLFYQTLHIGQRQTKRHHKAQKIYLTILLKVDQSKLKPSGYIYKHLH